MTAADFTRLIEVLSGASAVCAFGLGYIGGYMQ